MSSEHDPEAILDEAARQEAEELAATEAVIKDVLERLRATLGSQRYSAAAAFWNALAEVMEPMKAEIESDRDAFKPLVADLVTELDHLASLKERIFAIRSSKQGDTDDRPVH